MSNQASEDNLDEVLDNIFWLGFKFATTKLDKTPNEHLAEAKETLTDLIRTEKLKLLAEVKEAHRDGYMRGVSDFSGYFMDASIAGQRNPIMPEIAIELREAYRPPILSTKLEADL